MLGYRKDRFRMTILISLIVILSISANARSIDGYVKDSKTGEYLPGATVMIGGTQIGASSDFRGQFVIRDVPSDIDSLRLEIHLIGYEERIIDLAVADESQPLEILLTPSPWKMDNVVVTGTRRSYILKDVPVTTELITSDEFKQTGALTVDEALH